MSNFYFGAALSAHQTEGNNQNSDWWKFEQTTLKANKQAPSGLATDHWNRFDEDFRLAHELGHNCHRFSIEWAKIEPEQGKIDYTAIEHYQKVFESLKKHQLTPFVTLFHFTLPQWFADLGGFEKKSNIRHFVNYCKLIATTFQNQLQHIITINEPEILTYHGYLIKKWPPLKNNYFVYKKVLNNLALAHRLVYTDLKSICPDFQIGVAKNNQIFRPDRINNPFDHLLAYLLKKEWNEYFLDKINKHQDFIGLNYYFYRCVRAEWNLMDNFYQAAYPTSRRTDMGWEVYPKGLYQNIQELNKKYKKPIIVTESGVADHADKMREEVIKESLYWVFKAKEEGLDVKGYIHWALTDNYEWDSGFKPCFGLVKIDYGDDLGRTVRPSALIYRDLINSYLNNLEKK